MKYTLALVFNNSVKHVIISRVNKHVEGRKKRKENIKYIGHVEST